MGILRGRSLLTAVLLVAMPVAADRPVPGEGRILFGKVRLGEVRRRLLRTSRLRVLALELRQPLSLVAKAADSFCCWNDI